MREITMRGPATVDINVVEAKLRLVAPDASVRFEASSNAWPADGVRIELRGTPRWAWVFLRSPTLVGMNTQLAAGASALLAVESHRRDFAAALEALREGQLPFVALSLVGDLVAEVARPPGAPLTQPQLTTRELMILHGLSLGLMAEDIADRLGVSERTVAAHLAAIAAKVPDSDWADALTRVHGLDLPRSVGSITLSLVRLLGFNNN